MAAIIAILTSVRTSPHSRLAGVLRRLRGFLIGSDSLCVCLCARGALEMIEPHVWHTSSIDADDMATESSCLLRDMYSIV